MPPSCSCLDNFDAHTLLPALILTPKRLACQMEESCGRYEVFLKRLELSSDPGAREYLRSTNAQMLEAGGDWGGEQQVWGLRGVASHNPSTLPDQSGNAT